MRPPASGADLAGPLAIDASALSSLKQQAKSSPRDALKAAASQFEALFVQMLMKSMRDALPQDGMLSSETSKTYQSMFDQQIALSMSKTGGIGLAKVLERQLAPAIKGAATEGGHGAESNRVKGGAFEDGRGSVSEGVKGAATQGAPRAVTSTRAVPARLAALASAAKSATAVSGVDAAAGDASTSSVPANVRSFVDKMRPYAEAAARAVGVPADLLLAQAGLETGWGRSQPKAADGSTSHNLFGVKAGRSWNGAVALASTTEYVAGAVVRTVDRFRSYRSYTEAFQDFGRLITGNARYAAAVAKTDDPAAYARGLQDGGYATDPRYADKLMRAIDLVTRHSHDQARAAQVVAAAAVNKADEAERLARTRT
jgi:flagellar protein FlgJ